MQLKSFKTSAMAKTIQGDSNLPVYSTLRTSTPVIAQLGGGAGFPTFCTQVQKWWNPKFPYFQRGRGETDFPAFIPKSKTGEILKSLLGVGGQVFQFLFPSPQNWWNPSQIFGVWGGGRGVVDLTFGNLSKS